MSELTRCNHCTLQDMERRAKERGVKVTVEQIPDHRDPMHGWYAVRYSDDPEPAAYFMSLTVGCCC